MVGFIIENQEQYAGKHLLIDLYDCQYNAPREEIEDCLITACQAIGATVLFHHSHPFEGGGSSGVVILAESHASFHQWPEEHFIAIDIFVCGTCDPMLALAPLQKLFQPLRHNIQLVRRGASNLV